MKVAIVGASGAVGQEFLRVLEERNFPYRVFGLDYNEGENYGNVSFYKCDVTKMDSVEKAYEEISKEAKELAAVIHTAGIYDLDSLIEMDEERFVKIFDVNGTNTTLRPASEMSDVRRGPLVDIASLAT